MGDIRYGAAGGNQAKVADKFAIWQITAGAYGVWVDFQPSTPDGSYTVQWQWASALTSVTNSAVPTIGLADSNEGFHSGTVMSKGAAAAAPTTDAPAIACSATSNVGWTRGVWVPSARVLQIWAATANVDLTMGFRLFEHRGGDRGHAVLGGRFHV